MSSKDTQRTSPEKAFYQSSNGDVWSLSEDPTTGLLAVKHVANAQAGGHVSFLDIESFIRGGNGPEHQAFRQLAVPAASATVLIACDIHPASSPRHHDLAEAIQSLGAWWHHLETVWIVRSNKPLAEIKSQLQCHVGMDDQLLIMDVSGVKTEWTGVNETGSAWLTENVLRSVLT